MDSKGWISIPLISKFNTIRSLTTNIQRIKVILRLSSILEVRDDHVRLKNRQWAKYISPNAAVSEFDSEDEEAEREK